jgi:hypothetical protein
MVVGAVPPTAYPVLGVRGVLGEGAEGALLGNGVEVDEVGERRADCTREPDVLRQGTFAHNTVSEI